MLYLTLSYIMLKDSQTYMKKLCAWLFTTDIFLL